MASYPLPVFHFQVEWGGSSANFSEVSGLTIQVKKIDYRGGLNKEFSMTTMPGIPEFTNVTLKRGIVPADNDFFKWLSTVKMNEVERRDVNVSLLNGDHAPVMTWKIKSAWPVKVDGPGLNASGNEVALETIELAHEGITIENG